MPLFCIHALDESGKLPVREANYPAHRTYLAEAAAQGVMIHASGPLVSDDGGTMIGSLFIVECDSIDVARRFNAGDPFAKANLWASVVIKRFDLKRGAVGQG
jgi:uncharacterized protein